MGGRGEGRGTEKNVWAPRIRCHPLRHTRFAPESAENGASQMPVCSVEVCTLVGQVSPRGALPRLTRKAAAAMLLLHAARSFGTARTRAQSVARAALSPSAGTCRAARHARAGTHRHVVTAPNSKLAMRNCAWPNCPSFKHVQFQLSNVDFLSWMMLGLHRACARSGGHLAAGVAARRGAVRVAALAGAMEVGSMLRLKTAVKALFHSPALKRARHCSLRGASLPSKAAG